MLFQRRSPLRFDSGWSTVAIAILMALLAAVVIALIALLGGGKETVASRSAAAFAEAQRRGIPVAEAAHGHGALSPGATAGDHAAEHRPSAETEPDHAEHGKTEMPGHGQHGMTQPDVRADSPHAGMQHGSVAGAPRQGATRPTTAAAAGHAGHGAMPQPPALMAGGAPPSPLTAKSAVARPGQPSATLEPDPLDAPAQTSELDAKRSAELAAEMESGRHGMMHGTGSYRQLDAGRESVPIGQPTPAPHRHGSSPGSMPAPTPTPDTKRPHPAATPIPTPGEHVHPGGGQR